MKQIINTNMTLAISYVKTYPLEVEIDTLVFDDWLGNDLIADAGLVDEYIWEEILPTEIAQILVGTDPSVNYSILNVVSDAKDVQDFLAVAINDLKDCCKAALPDWTYCPVCSNKLKK